MQVSWTAFCPISAEDCDRNHALSAGRGLDVSTMRGWGKVAVVGGGPSIACQVDELRGWPGDVWAINGAAAWCRSFGIPATLFIVDPDPSMAACCRGAGRAVVSSMCDPAVFDALNRAAVYRLPPGNRGSCAAAAAPSAAFLAGYDEVTLFGCEASFELGRPSHAYQDDGYTDLIRVRCGPEEYLTRPALLIQAVEVSAILRAFPMVRERSGGLLRAMAEHVEHEVTWLSPEVRVEAAA